MPLIQFKSTTLINAFILNALASALIAVTAVEVRQYIRESKQYVTEEQKARQVFIVTFGVALFVYTLLHVLFGFGGGMLSNN
jgi:hypothetical protein